MKKILLIFTVILLINSQINHGAAVSPSISDEINKFELRVKMIPVKIDDLRQKIAMSEVYLNEISDVYDSHKQYRTKVMTDAEKKCWEQLLKINIDNTEVMKKELVNLENDLEFGITKAWLDMLIKTQAEG